MKIGDQCVDEQARTDEDGRSEAILAGLRHVAWKGRAIAQLDRSGIECLVCPIAGKGHAEDQKNVLGQINVGHTRLRWSIGLVTGASVLTLTLVARCDFSRMTQPVQPSSHVRSSGARKMRDSVSIPQDLHDIAQTGIVPLVTAHQSFRQSALKRCHGPEVRLYELPHTCELYPPSLTGSRLPTA